MDTAQRDGMDEGRNFLHLSAFFPQNIDRPAGRVEGIVSGITGDPIRYFIPDPLAQLIERSRAGIKPRAVLQNETAVAVCLTRPASTRGIGFVVDPEQALRFGRLLINRRPYRTREQLLALGKEISRKSHQYREEIIYAGAAVASAAKVVFAPYPLIPNLMEGLFDAASRDWPEVDPTVLTAVAGFYGVSVHPFIDGNGRWSRLVAASIGLTSGQVLPAMVNVTFQNACKAELADLVWPQARSYGLRRYIEVSWRFEEVFMEKLQSSGAVESAINLGDTLKRSATHLRNHQEAVIELHGRGEIPLQRLRALYGMSARAFDGLIERLRNSAPHVEISSDALSVRSLHALFDESIQYAKASVFEEGKAYA